MLATKESAKDFQFFKLSDRDEIVMAIIQAYEYLTEESEVVSDTEIVGNLMDLFVMEQIERQVVFGDMPLCHSQEECLAAMNSTEDGAFDEIYTSQMEILGGWGTFGNPEYSYGLKDNLEVQFASDVIRILDELQLFYMSFVKEWHPGAHVSTELCGRIQEVKSGPLQEVW